jgi:hypothetical protein
MAQVSTRPEGKTSTLSRQSSAGRHQNARNRAGRKGQTPVLGRLHIASIFGFQKSLPRLRRDLGDGPSGLLPCDELCGSYLKADTGSIGGFRPERRSCPTSASRRFSPSPFLSAGRLWSRSVFVFSFLAFLLLLWSECATHVVLHRVSIRTLHELVESSVRFGVQWENRCCYFWNGLKSQNGLAVIGTRGLRNSSA